MLSRLAQLSNQIPRPFSNSAFAFVATLRPALSITMTSSADGRTHRMIHTAACLIIGDEVLGGKV